jgi:hypothetical protein
MNRAYMQSRSSSRKIDSSRRRLLCDSCLSAFTCCTVRRVIKYPVHTGVFRNLALKHAVVQPAFGRPLDHLDSHLP